MALLRTGSVTARLAQNLVISPSAIPGNTTARETYTLNGLQTDMAVVVNQLTVTAGVYLIGARVSAANTLQLDWWNSTGGSLTPTASQTVYVVAV